MQSEAMRNNQLNRGQLQSGLLQEGFQNAQQQALLQLQAQQGLGTYQSQLGGATKTNWSRPTSRGPRSS